MTTGKWPKYVHIFALLISVFIGAQMLDMWLSSIRGGDAPSYILLSRAIAVGAGFVDINVPGAPSHTQYPPLLPLVIAPITYLFGYNFAWMKLLIVLFGIGAVALSARLFMKEDKATGAIVALLFATNFYFTIFLNEVMTEVPYAFLTLLAFLCLGRTGPKGNAFLFLSAIVLVSVYMMRSIGLSVWLAAIVALFLEERGNAPEARRYKRLLLFAVIAIVPFILWSIRSHLYAEGVSTYQSIFMQADYYSVDSGVATLGSLFERFFKNASYYAEAIPRTLLTWSYVKNDLPWPLVPIISYFILAVFLVGLIQGLALKRRAMDFYVAIYLALVLVWPVYGQGDARRYVIPLIPFLYYYVFSGASVLASYAGRVRGASPSGRLYVAIAACVFLLFNFIELSSSLNPLYAGKRISSGVNNLFAGRVEAVSYESTGAAYLAPCYRDYIKAVYALKSNLGEGDVLLVRKPELVALITGGLAVRLPYTADPEDFRVFLERHNVGYAIADTCYAETRSYLLPFVEHGSGDFEKLLDVGGTTVLKYAPKGG